MSTEDEDSTVGSKILLHPNTTPKVSLSHPEGVYEHLRLDGTLVSEMDRLELGPSPRKNKIKKSKPILDKFYTVPSYSKRCIDTVFEHYNQADFDLIIEPSAGNGSFYHQIASPAKVGIDIAPETPELLNMDFFDYCPPPMETPNILVIGNPPFGRVCSLAIKFFNHAADWANVIAFIIPRTFRRPSVQNKLNSKFHLIHDEDVPQSPCCFVPKMMVKCCFQIWEKKPEDRPIIDLPVEHADWTFLAFGPLDDKGQPTPPMGADFAIRAYGGNIGEITTDQLSELRPKSWHWIKSNIDIDILKNRFTQLDYSSSANTARQNSMGRGELVKLYDDFIHTIT